MTAAALASAGHTRAIRDLATAHLSDPLTGEVPAGAEFADEPLFRETCATLSRVPWLAGSPFPHGVWVRKAADVVTAADDETRPLRIAREVTG